MNNRDLEKEEKAQKDKEKAAGQRQERKNRDAFQELLKQHKEAGRIEPRMAWKVSGHSLRAPEMHLPTREVLVAPRLALHAGVSCYNRW